ncbi:PepSY domain-containing protein [Bacillus piscicola]|uniref:PepSY domain-containing protein n=1 Tax=Bacillus piscicola TaxID=1632684 RepID=UPI001F0A033D|nr:PepSY domain-containing protein [Bacillus piscicola]
MRRWLIGIAGFLILLFIAGAVIIYLTARSTLAEELNEAEAVMLQEEDVQAVHDVSYYYGEEAVYTGDAVLDNENRVWLFVVNGNVVKKLGKKSTLPPEEAAAIVKNRFKLKKVRSITPGIEKNEPLYEITFEKDGRLHYYYMRMEDGTFIKRYSLKQS